MGRVGVLGVVTFLFVLAGSVEAGQKRASFGVSVTVVYNCAMDTKALSPEARKVVEASCAKQSYPAPPGSTAKGGNQKPKK
jgi:hypothetical protein